MNRLKKIWHSPLVTIAVFEFYENIRNKWLFIYGLTFLVLSALIIYLGITDPLQAAGSLLSLVLLLVPLFSLVFGSISFSESLSFVETLVSQPISRSDIYIGKLLGLGAGLTLSFILGMGIGTSFQIGTFEAGLGNYILLLALGCLLTLIFLSLAFCLATIVRKRELLFGWVLLAWFGCFVLYDLVVVGVVLLFGDYPLEIPMLVLVFFNPIDLARVILLVHSDLSAMMGYSGAVFQKYLGQGWGVGLGVGAMVLWSLIPAVLGLSFFKRRDL